MNNIYPIIGIATGINGISLVVVCYAVKKIINGSIESIEKRIKIEREDRVKTNGEMWDAFNKHGHVGLKGDDSRVTR